MDSYYDPNDRKYYITPQSVETVIQEEIQRAKKPADAPASEAFGSTVERVKHFRMPNQQVSVDEKTVQEMEREIPDLKISNRGKDYLIDILKSERSNFVEQVIQANRKLGELETNLL